MAFKKMPFFAEKTQGKRLWEIKSEFEGMNNNRDVNYKKCKYNTA
jgi:hypothetical protein